MSDASQTVAERIKVREVTGVFRSREALEEAVDALFSAGFDRADIDLMASVDAVVEKLGGLYAPAEELADVADVPRQAFLARADIIIPLAAAGGVLTYIGAIAGGLGVIASGGALAMAIAAAGVGGAAAGGLGMLIARSLGKKHGREIEEQLATGGLLLWIRVRSPDREEKAQKILKDHGAAAFRVHEIEIDKRFEDIPLSSLVLDPWLGSEPLGDPA